MLGAIVRIVTRASWAETLTAWIAPSIKTRHNIPVRLTFPISRRIWDPGYDTVLSADSVKLITLGLAFIQCRATVYDFETASSSILGPQGSTLAHGEEFVLHESHINFGSLGLYETDASADDSPVSTSIRALEKISLEEKDKCFTAAADACGRRAERSRWKSKSILGAQRITAGTRQAIRTSAMVAPPSM